MFMLHKETVVDTTLDRAWNFISKPQNLNLITPDDMHFKIITHLPEKMNEGMMIHYRVRIPYLGIRSWVSRIYDVVEGHSFVDEQVAGPYKYWHHHHVIEPVDNGVLFTDRITYLPPFGPVGTLANRLFVRKSLNRIFTYREERIHELLAG